MEGAPQGQDKNGCDAAVAVDFPDVKRLEVQQYIVQLLFSPQFRAFAAEAGQVLGELNRGLTPSNREGVTLTDEVVFGTARSNQEVAPPPPPEPQPASTRTSVESSGEVAGEVSGSEHGPARLMHESSGYGQYMDRVAEDGTSGRQRGKRDAGEGKNCVPVGVKGLRAQQEKRQLLHKKQRRQQLDVGSSNVSRGRKRSRGRGRGKGSSTNEVQVPIDIAQGKGRRSAGRAASKVVADALHQLMYHKEATPFLHKLEPFEEGYLSVVKHPITLYDMKDRLLAGGYDSTHSLMQDVTLMCSNYSAWHRNSIADQELAERFRAFAAEILTDPKAAELGSGM
ncbi:unnamed protein product [Chrysoparadoxa australica]